MKRFWMLCALMVGLGKYLYDNDGIHNGYTLYS